jgi:hypothetical protein
LDERNSKILNGSQQYSNAHGYDGELILFFKKFTNKFTAPNANVQLKLGQYSVALGENLEGTLTVSSMEDFDATAMRNLLR